MKFNRLVSMLLVLLLMFSASALADALVWDFTSGEAATSYASSYTMDYVLISGGDCHVRDYPSLSGNSLGVLYNGQKATCLGGQSTDNRGVVWYQIDFRGQSAWVSSKYAKLNGTGSTTTYVTITGGQCYMRLSPSLSATTLAVLEEGTRTIYQGRTSTDNRGVDWYQVSYNGQAGWVSSKYAKFGGSTPSTSSGYVKATSYKVNLRDQPNLNGKDIGTMDEGETATYLGQKSTDSRGVIWYKVRFAGKTGWVSSRYTKLYN